MSHDEADTVPLAKVQDQVHEMKDMMQDNIKKAADRGEDLEEVQEKAEHLSHAAGEFSTSAVRLKKKLLCQNVKLFGIILVIIAVVVLAVVIVIIVVSVTAHK